MSNHCLNVEWTVPNAYIRERTALDTLADPYTILKDRSLVVYAFWQFLIKGRQK